MTYSWCIDYGTHTVILLRTRTNPSSGLTHSIILTLILLALAHPPSPNHPRHAQNCHSHRYGICRNRAAASVEGQVDWEQVKKEIQTRRMQEVNNTRQALQLAAQKKANIAQVRMCMQYYLSHTCICLHALGTVMAATQYASAHIRFHVIKAAHRHSSIATMRRIRYIMLHLSRT